MPDDPTPAASRSEWGDVILALGLIAGLVALFLIEVETAAMHELSGPLGLVKGTAMWVALGIEVLSALVVVIGVVATVGSFVAQTVRPTAATFDAIGSLRLQLGRVLTFGLEVTLAADIIQVAFHPTQAELLTAGTVVLLRTLLNLFLEREIRSVEARTGEDAMEPMDEA